MSWKSILKSSNSDKNYIAEERKKHRTLRIKQMFAKMKMSGYGKDSEEMLELVARFFDMNPTKKEEEDFLSFYDGLKQESTPKTPMEELRAKQKESQRKLDSKRDR